MTQAVSQSLVTIPTSAESPAETAETSTAEPDGNSAAPRAETKTDPAPQAEDKTLQIARRFGNVAKKEAESRRRANEIAQREAAAEAREKAAAEKEKELDAALEDPVKWYLDKGKDPVEAARRFGKPLTEEQKEIKAIKDRLEKEDKAREEQAKAWEERQAEEKRATVMRNFVKGIDRVECPNLTSLYDPHEVPALVTELFARPANREDPRGPTLLQAFRDQKGRNPTDVEIREVLEYEAEERATRNEEARRLRAQRLAQATEQSGQEQAGNGAGPKGISNQHAATTSSGKRKPASLEERRRLARNELTAALETEAAARRGS